MVFTRSENQNCTPNWNSSEANTTTSSVGTAAMPANNATRRRCSWATARPLRRLVIRMANRRPISTTNSIAGTRQATSTSATSGCDAPVAGTSRRVSSA